ncbi:N-acetylglucosamine-6-phosphate deacetylase [Terriglobus roseus]|uniref:N-acetylglucosamine-6-phosphate deacetylase n=1 Tax=Terriglobus roseus TaxID=392734 RepID=A0A1H4JUX8_9BACT|nr:amidohydrolase family protein [Terriglobus roseus]SEB49806.1 N-acetylglucosamine-6-phosphate deacetylase [Terriglobus roseus]
MKGFDLTGKSLETGTGLRVRVENGLIARIEATSEDCEYFLSPGMIDLQVNGYAGFDVNADDVSVQTIANLTEQMLRHGVTSFAPTIISAREEKICHALNVIAVARGRMPHVQACIPYVHVEGPYISPLDGYRGAHEASVIRAPSIAEFERWQSAAQGCVGMVTLSAHYTEAPAYISHLAARGAHVALGHTHADAIQIRRAVDAGARFSTHLGNGLPTEIPRHKNPLWSQLAEDKLVASVIADGHHLPAEMLKAFLRAKGADCVLLVSDSVALAGMPAGIYETPVGGWVELREDGCLCIAGKDLLAGSTATMTTCVKGVMAMTGVSLAQAMRMATELPGRVVGGRGRLAEGCDADLMRFRWKNGLEIDAVWSRGEQRYGRAA